MDRLSTGNLSSPKFVDCVMKKIGHGLSEGEAANVLSDHLQVTVATRTVTSTRSVGDVPTDFSKCSKEGIDEVPAKLKDNQGQFQYKYVCIKKKIQYKYA